MRFARFGLARLGCWLLLAVLTAAGSAPREVRADEPPPVPNFVVVLIDDLGYADIGPFGSKLHRTPHLDRMAREGQRLTSFYAAPVCSPSRAQLLTGCYPPRVSIPGVLFPAAGVGLNPEEMTIARVLKQQGYATACIGKWHLGDQPDFLPTRHGFDRYFGIPYSNDMQRVCLETGKRVTPLLRDEKVIELLEDEQQRTITARYTEEAIAFLRENKDRPFFLYLPHTAVHVPIFPGEAFRGRSPHGGYSDWVEELDWSTGQILQTLRELELERRTLVIFTSDNGPWAAMGKNGGLATPLRGAKGGTFEGGVRVPTIAWWPGTIEAGSTCDAVAGTTDLLPTFAALAGAKLPAEPKIDGQDIAPLLTGRTQKSPHEAWFYFQGNQLQAVRSGPWKLALTAQSDGMGLGARPDAAVGGRLYHLDDDIGETTDVAAEHPEVVARLRALAEPMAEEIGGGRGPGVRPPGRVTRPVTLYPVKPPPPSPPARPIDWESLKAGDTVPAASAPRVANTPLHFTCEVEPKSKHGIILAHGGTVVGYALHLREGRVVFSVRTGDKETASITADETPDGRLAIEARLDRGGAMTLAINGRTAATGRAAGLLPRQPAEDFCVGHDNGHPVVDYGGKTDAAGTIAKVRVAAALP